MARVKALRRSGGWHWALALSGALLLHALAWWLLRTSYASPPAADARPLWHVTLRTAAPAPISAAPAQPAPAPTPETAAPAPAAPTQPPERADERATPPEAPTPIAPAAEPRPRPLPPPVPRPAVQAPSPEPTPAPPLPQTRWLDAAQADRAPAPRDNQWLLTPDQPWPQDFPKVRIQIWVSASGRIERFEVEGAAASDPAVQALFAPLPETPMLPALIGRVPVPSTMRIELWAGDQGDQGHAPDFIAPLAPHAGEP